jgi:hypothetical protein
MYICVCIHGAHRAPAAAFSFVTLAQSHSTAFSEAVGQAASQSGQLPLLLTEYNAGLCYGGTNLSGLDGAYAAAFVARQVSANRSLCSSLTERLIAWMRPGSVPQ